MFFFFRLKNAMAPPAFAVGAGELLKFYVVLAASKDTIYRPMEMSLFEQLTFNAHFCVEPPTILYEKVTSREVSKLYKKLTFVEQEWQTMHSFEHVVGESIVDAPFQSKKPHRLPNGDYCFQLVLPISKRDFLVQLRRYNVTVTICRRC
jgi:hypothetical protein